jgi:hypothetical protein
MTCTHITDTLNLNQCLIDCLEALHQKESRGDWNKKSDYEEGGLYLPASLYNLSCFWLEVRITPYLLYVQYISTSGTTCSLVSHALETHQKNAPQEENHE